MQTVALSEVSSLGVRVMSEVAPAEVMPEASAVPTEAAKDANPSDLAGKPLSAKENNLLLIALAHYGRIRKADEPVAANIAAKLGGLGFYRHTVDSITPTAEKRAIAAEAKKKADEEKKRAAAAAAREKNPPKKGTGKGGKKNPKKKKTEEAAVPATEIVEE